MEPVRLGPVDASARLGSIFFDVFEVIGGVSVTPAGARVQLNKGADSCRSLIASVQRDGLTPTAPCNDKSVESQEQDLDLIL